MAAQPFAVKELPSQQTPPIVINGAIRHAGLDRWASRLCSISQAKDRIAAALAAATIARATRPIARISNKPTTHTSDGT
jgi:hypothetical protein